MTYTSGQIDVNKFNDFLDKATEAVSCDAECQRQKKEDELKRRFIRARALMTQAEPRFQLAKKNYYDFVSGEGAFEEMMEKEYSQKAEQLTAQFREKMDGAIRQIQTEIDTYVSVVANYQNVEDLHQHYLRENAFLYKKMKEGTHDVLTNQRKTYYEDQQNDQLNLYYYYILWVLYGVAYLGLVVVTLTYPSGMSGRKKAGVIFGFAILPFVAAFLFSSRLNMIHKIIGLLPSLPEENM